MVTRCPVCTEATPPCLAPCLSYSAVIALRDGEKVIGTYSKKEIKDWFIIIREIAVIGIPE